MAEFKSKMFVIKRNGLKQDVHFDKITARIGKLAYGLNADFCDPVSAPCKLSVVLLSPDSSWESYFMFVGVSQRVIRLLSSPWMF